MVVRLCRALGCRCPVSCIVVRPERTGDVANRASQDHSRSAERSGQATAAGNLPRLYWVNWFRKGDDGSFLWPGFGDNSRVIKWIIEEVEGSGDGVDTPIGRGSGVLRLLSGSKN